MADENLVPRVPPHSEEAEQSVIGSILIDHEAVGVAAENLKPEDFYNLRHKEIFEAILDLYHDGRAVDLVTLKSQLEQRGKLEAAGDMKYLTQVAAAVPNSVHIRQYVKIVKDKALYRRFIQLGNQVLQQSFSTETPIEQLSESVEKQVFNILRKDESGIRVSYVLTLLLDKDEEKAAQLEQKYEKLIEKKPLENEREEGRKFITEIKKIYERRKAQEISQQ